MHIALAAAVLPLVYVGNLLRERNEGETHMNQYLKVSIAAMLCALLFAGIVAGGVSERASMQAIEKEELKEFINNLPSTDPKTLDLMKEKNYVLRTQGKIPKITNGTEVYEWQKKIDQIRTSLNENKDLNAYLYPSGPLVAYGTDAKGYFVVMLCNEKSAIKEEDINAIAEVITKYATQLNIKDVPIVFTNEGPINPVSSSLSMVEATSFKPYYVKYYSPVMAGIAHSVANPAVGQAQLGTIGFTAKKNSDGTKGYVIAEHVAWWTTGLSSYQPLVGNANYTGAVSIIGANTDAAFVPYSSVTSKMHIGGGSIVDIAGTYSGGISGMILKKSGSSSGSVTGTYRAVLTGQNVLGHTMDRIEVMSTSCANGDSGGPVYSVNNGKYKIVGIISASGTYGGSAATFYIPYGEVASKLGITALKV